MLKNCKIAGIGVDPQAYHSVEIPRGHHDYPVSPSMLKEFSRCMSRWVKGYNAPDSDAKAWGSLLDCLFLTPETFNDRYAIPPTHYIRDGERKEWRNDLRIKEVAAWHEANDGKVALSRTDWDNAELAVSALRKDATIAAFVDASDKQVMVTGEWHDPDTGLVIPLRCLMDLVPRRDTEFAKSLADLKTTRSAALIPFQRQVWQMGWHIQAAFDTDLYIESTKEDRCNWCLIAQESFPPWQTAKRILGEDYIALGRTAYQKALKLYAQCLKHNVWPDYDAHDEAAQSWSIVRPEPWMESEGLFAPKFEFVGEPDSQVEESDDVIP